MHSQISDLFGDRDKEINLQEQPGGPFIRLVRVLYACVCQTGMIILLRVWGEATPGYSFFYCMSWAIGFCPWFLLALIFVRYYLKIPKARLDSMRPVLYQSTLVSFCLAVNYLGVSTSNPHISGPAQIVLSQFPTVFALLFATIILKRNYCWQVWFGVLLIFSGALLQNLIPAVKEGEHSEAPIKWVLINIMGMLPLGFLPSCFEAFHKVRGTDEKRITIEWRMLWTNFILIFWLLAFVPLFGLLNQPPLNEFVEQNEHALQCVFQGKFHEEDGRTDTTNCPLA
eukprot:UN30823